MRSFAQLNALTLTALDGETLLGRRGCKVSGRLKELCTEAGSILRLRQVSDSDEHVQHLAMIELGVALLPGHMKALPPLLTRPLTDGFLLRSVMLAAVNGRRYSPALDAFLRLTRTRDFSSELDLAA